MATGVSTARNDRDEDDVARGGDSFGRAAARAGTPQRKASSVRTTSDGRPRPHPGVGGYNDSRGSSTVKHDPTPKGGGTSKTPRNRF